MIKQSKSPGVRTSVGLGHFRVSRVRSRGSFHSIAVSSVLVASVMAWGDHSVVGAVETSSTVCSPTVTSVGGATVLSFTTVGSCSWTVPAGVTAAEVLIVAGGGGGGGFWGGGGGGGGVLHGSSIAMNPGAVVTVTVGNGGAGSSSTGSFTIEDFASRGSSGGDSSFDGATANGGGGGGGFGTVYASVGIGLAGGSSGGHGELAGGATGTASNQTAPSGYVAFGNAGGSNGARTVAGSGGGGAGAAGSASSSLTGGDGGAGQSFDITGTPTYYAGGGGGGTFGTPGAGGVGGGGTGSNGNANPSPGVDGTGGGGGAAGYTASFDPYLLGAAGGSGIVIVRYPPQATCDFTSVTTLSQGGWSSKSSSTQLNALWSAVIAPNSLRIGGDSRSVTLDSPDAVRSFLPQSGTPSVLPSGNATNVSNKQLKNTLAGQAVALTLNVALNPDIASAVLLGISFEGTVSDLLDAVNAALNGTGSPSKAELSRLTKLAEYVNLSFPNGIDAGRLTCS